MAANDGRIAFDSNRFGNNQIFIMNSDGTGQTRLTNNQANDIHPALSPDGKKIAFASDRDGGNTYHIYVMNADGTGQTRLTNNMVIDSQPVWSPDGLMIAFVSTMSGNNEIYLMKADGLGQTRLTNINANNAGPSWSPKGKKIAFSSNVNGPNYQIYVINTNGASLTQLTFGPAEMDNWQPAWSPDGKKIAFTSAHHSYSHLVLMKANGSTQVEIPNTKHAWTPAWSPDGSQIAFSSDYDGALYQIYVINPDGSARTQITTTPNGDNSNPSWSKIPATITLESTGTYFVGDHIPVRGINTISALTWLYLIGPNLNPNGIFLGKINVGGIGYTWMFDWNTAGTAGGSLDAGIYTLYAFAHSVDLSKLNEKQFAMCSVVLKKPGV
jgi:Tol biopolymer transport system component